MTKQEYKEMLKVTGQSAEDKVITDTEFLIDDKNYKEAKENIQWAKEVDLIDSETAKYLMNEIKLSKKGNWLVPWNNI